MFAEIGPFELDMVINASFIYMLCTLFVVVFAIVKLSIYKSTRSKITDQIVLSTNIIRKCQFNIWKKYKIQLGRHRQIGSDFDNVS